MTWTWRGEDLVTKATGEAQSGPLRLGFDRSVKVEFRGLALSSDNSLLLYRDLDDALGLTDTAAALIGDLRTGRNGRHRFRGPPAPVGLLASFRLRGRQRCRPTVPRSGDPPACRRTVSQTSCGLGQRDGPVRDRDSPVHGD